MLVARARPAALKRDRRPCEHRCVSRGRPVVLPQKVLGLTIDAEWAANVPEYDRRFGMGWARARMWEQYAENHTGVCLVFAKDAFKAVVLRQLQARSADARGSVVRYAKTGLAGSHASTTLLSPDVAGSDQARRH